MKKAVIVGISGQVGPYLARHLLSLGYEVHGTSRRAAPDATLNLVRLGIERRVALHRLDPVDESRTRAVLATVGPDEVYLLAGQSSVAHSFARPQETIESTTGIVSTVLAAQRTFAPGLRLFFPSSSDCFGSTSMPVDIGTSFHPLSPYAAARAVAHDMVVAQRVQHGLYAVSGVLFNHESPLRPETFVTRKIVRAATRIAGGSKEKLALGNLDVERDWGWAPEYVAAMHLMLQQAQPDDFVIATGRSSTLRDFTAAVFATVGLDWRDHVESSPDLYRPTELLHSRAVTDRTRDRLGWQARIHGSALAERLVECERTGTWG